MNPEDIKKLKSLLGPEFTEAEIDDILKEDPALGGSADSLEHAFHALQNEEPPPLSLGFTSRVLERILTPSLWKRLREGFLTPRRLSLAGGLAVMVLAATFLGPRFFTKTTFPGLSFREGVGAHQEKMFYVQFALKNPRAHAVSVAGDFNQWNEIPLTLADAREGLYTVELPIPSGTYSYAFLVDGKTWIADPTADRVIDDGFGNKNSLINL
jgi:hypothetical protein